MKSLLAELILVVPIIKVREQTSKLLIEKIYNFTLHLYLFFSYINIQEKRFVYTHEPEDIKLICLLNIIKVQIYPCPTFKHFL